MRPTRTKIAALLLWIPMLSLSGCGQGGGDSVRVDGSSTVYPITEAVAEEFRPGHPNIDVAVGISGTGGGMKKFVAGLIDICDASRAIKPIETESLEAAGIEYLELTIAFDGLAVVVHPDNDWVDCLTVEQLREIWKPDSTVRNWSDLDPSWPDKEIKLYGPGTDSGTLDYFSEAVVGKSMAIRPDYSASENDNMLVRGVSNDEYSLGFFGYAYFEENSELLKLLGVDGGDGCVKPTLETVVSGTYRPLSRPLYLYVRKDALARPPVQAFVLFYLDNSANLVQDVGYFPTPPEQLAEARAAVEAVISK